MCVCVCVVVRIHRKLVYAHCTCLPYKDLWINNMFVLCLCGHMCPCLYVHSLCVLFVCVHVCVCVCMGLCMCVCKCVMSVCNVHVCE